MKHFDFHDEGATLIELALVLPLVLGIVFFLLALALSQNASSSLHSSMTQAAQISLTRADPLLLNLPAGVIPLLQNWHDGNPSNTDDLGTGALGTLFMKNIDSADFSTTMREDVLQIPTTFQSSGGPGEFPLWYYYVLAYIYQGMEQSIGNTIRYPCEDAAGCLICKFYHVGPQGNGFADESTTGPIANLPARGIHIRCRFRPEVSIVERIFRFVLKSDVSFAPEVQATVHTIDREFFP